MSDASKIFNLVMKMAPYFLGRPPMQNEPHEQKTVLDAKDVALINVRQKKGSVSVVLGTRDTGKTELAYRLAEFFDRPVFAVSPQQKPPGWIKLLKLEEIFTKVPPMSTLILDDLPSYMSNRDYSDPLIRDLERVIPMVRHEPNPPDYPIGEVHLIFASQSAAQADRYILDNDLCFFKPLGLLVQDIERPAIARLYRNIVDPEFDGKDDLFIKSHAYMYSRTYKGLISFKMVDR